MLTRIVHQVVHFLLSAGFAIIIATWISAAVGAAIAYTCQHDDTVKNLRGFLRFCFPGSLFTHRSSRLDVLFIGVGQLIPGSVYVPFMATNIGVAVLSERLLTAAFGAHALRAEPLWLWLALLACALVVQDFMTFLAHYLEHRVPALWELHKVHHSAELLIPITNRRFHPLQGIFDNLANAAGVGLFVGLACYALHLPIADNSIIGVDAYLLLNTLSFYHLRHSHIPLRYGWLERHLISPSQHQLHHSREQRHWDRNFGLCFSWWDRMFGTLIYSKPAERFTLGLPAPIQPQYATVAQLYLTPLRNLAQMAWQARPRLPAHGHASTAGDAASGISDPALS